MGRAAFGATLEAQAAPFYGGGKEAASPQQKEATDQLCMGSYRIYLFE